MVRRFDMSWNVPNEPRSSSERIVMAWVWLIVGGFFEVGFTTSLRFVDGFRNVPWTLAFLASVAVSMGLLEVASRSIPMGTAYAVWGGIGAVGTVVVGILWFHEPASLARVLLIFAIVAAIAALRATA
jgi:quaternary ammonium compound-resistance protein SugE